MEGCGTSIGASGEGKADISVSDEFCPSVEKSNPVMAAKGDRIEAENGITVEIADIFVPADPKLFKNPVTCVNFYLKGEKLKGYPTCFLDNSSYQIDDVICANVFKDYGVAIKHWEAKDGVLPVVVEAVTPPIETPLDIYNACMEAGNDIYGCLRYVPHTALSHEEKAVNGAYQTFYPPEHEAAGDYYASQWPICAGDVDALLGVALDQPKGGTLRYVVEETILDDPAYTIVGTVTGENAEFLFAAEKYDEWLQHNLGEMTGTDPNMCYTQMICHERSHIVWSSRLLWHPLEEGAARYIELNTASYLTYEPVMDKVAGFNEEVIFGFEQGNSTNHITIKPIVLPQEGFPVVLLEVSGDGSSYQVTTQPNTINLLTPALPDDYQLAVTDSGKSPDGKSTIRLRMYNLAIQEAFKRAVDCGEDAYHVNIGLWVDGEFYRCPQVEEAIEKGDVSYQPLDGTSDQIMIYNSGYCFFEGIKNAYEGNAGDWTGFFQQLTAAMSVFKTMPLPEQYDQSFCTLDVMQGILDSDIGSGTFDVKGFAEKFGYNDDIPWCKHPPILSGNSNYFGKSMFEAIE